MRQYLACVNIFYHTCLVLKFNFVIDLNIVSHELHFT